MSKEYTAVSHKDAEELVIELNALSKKDWEVLSIVFAPSTRTGVFGTYQAFLERDLPLKKTK